MLQPILDGLRRPYLFFPGLREKLHRSERGWIAQLQRSARCGASLAYVFNRALAIQKQERERGEKRSGCAKLCGLLTGWRCMSETSWLREIHSQVLQQSLRNLEAGWQRPFESLKQFKTGHAPGSEHRGGACAVPSLLFFARSGPQLILRQ